MPTMIYGAEVWYKKKCDMEQYELAHRAAAKRIQWLPQNTHNDAILSLIGWLNVEAVVDKRQLIFVGSIVRLPKLSFPRQVFEYRYKCMPSSGLVKQYCDLLCMYNLKAEFDEWLDGTSDMTYVRWKKIVGNRVKDYHYSCWRIQMSGSKRLYMYKQVVMDIKPNVWWLLVKENHRTRKTIQSVIKLLCGVLAFRSFNEEDNERQCLKCSNSDDETIEHVIMTCTHYSEIRYRYARHFEYFAIGFEDETQNVRKILGCEKEWVVYRWPYVREGLELCAKFLHEVVQKRFYSID